MAHVVHVDATRGDLVLLQPSQRSAQLGKPSIGEVDGVGEQKVVSHGVFRDVDAQLGPVGAAHARGFCTICAQTFVSSGREQSCPW